MSRNAKTCQYGSCLNPCENGEFQDREAALHFARWFARVEAEMCAHGELDPEDFRHLYEIGLSPADAVLADRLDAGVLSKNEIVVFHKRMIAELEEKIAIWKRGLANLEEPT